MKRYLRENFPQMPRHYEERIDQTLEEITAWQGRSGSRESARIWQRVSWVCGSAAAVFLCVLLFFTEFPSYAADIPILNRVIYTISPQVKETGEVEEKVASRTSEVLKEFMESRVVLYTGEENTGDGWQLNTNTLQAAYYFKDKIMEYYRPDRPVMPEVEITVRAVDAVRRGYEIAARVACDVLVEGQYCFSEKIEVVLIERPGYLTVIRMQEVGAQEEAAGQ